MSRIREWVDQAMLSAGNTKDEEVHKVTCRIPLHIYQALEHLAGCVGKTKTATAEELLEVAILDAVEVVTPDFKDVYQ